ncbi:MAG: HdeD family acid-resistance protein [Rhodobacterales bacterium]|nr:HdeD family acid-resistance protein [Rhodobacterales bacterium]
MGGWVFMLIAGVIALVGGIFALFNPLAASITAVLLTAWIFIIVGVIEIFGVFTATGWGGRLWALLLGALCIFLGIWILQNPIESGLALTWLVGILFLATGVTKVILSFGVRGTGYFWIVLLSGILSVVLGVMVLSNFPYSAAVVLGTLLAIELISSGVANIALALRLRETGPKTA